METSSVEPFKTAKGPLHGSVLSPCEDSVLRGWDPKVLLHCPSPFPSTLIKRGDSWPPLPRVEIIKKVSTKVRACAGGSSFRLPKGEHLPALPGRTGTPPRCPRRAAAAPPQAFLLRHSKIAAVVRGEWSLQPRVTQSHSIFNSNKQYIYT